MKSGVNALDRLCVFVCMCVCERGGERENRRMGIVEGGGEEIIQTLHYTHSYTHTASHTFTYTYIHHLPSVQEVVTNFI